MLECREHKQSVIREWMVIVGRIGFGFSRHCTAQPQPLSTTSMCATLACCYRYTWNETFSSLRTKLSLAATLIIIQVASMHDEDSLKCCKYIESMAGKSVS